MARVYGFGVFKDPPSQIWADFSHRSDEHVILGEGEIEIEGKSQQPQIVKEFFIPVYALNTVRNIGSKNNVWYYGYKNS